MKSFLFTLLSLFISSHLSASDRMILWRGDGSGNFPDARLSTDWSDPANRLWEMPLAHSNASPIKIGDRLYLTEEPSTLMCVDAKSGKLIWKRENEFLDLLGLSDEEMKKAEATLQASQELDRKMARLSYNMNRFERKLNKEQGWKEGRSIYFGMLREYSELGRLKVQMHEGNEYGDVVLPPTQSGNGYTSYVPTSDGSNLYVSFGTGTVVAYNLEGEKQWHRILEHPDHQYGGSTFPVLAGDTLVVRFKDYVGLDKRTGEELWRTESTPTFGSPVVFAVEGENYLLTGRGGVLRGRDGTQIVPDLAEWSKGGRDAHSTPILEGDSIYFVKAGGGRSYTDSQTLKFSIPDTIEELETSGLRTAWLTVLKKGRYYASPLFHDGILYLASRDHQLITLDAEDGSVLYNVKIEGMLDPFISSVTLVGDSIFLGSGDGFAIFVQPGRVFKELSRSKLMSFRSTPIFDGKLGYLRANESLMAFGNP